MQASRAGILCVCVYVCRAGILCVCVETLYVSYIMLLYTSTL